MLTEWFRLSEGHDPNLLLSIKFELVISVDVTGPYHKACYNLEGDGPLAMVAYEQIEIVYHIFAESSMDMMSSYPNVQASYTRNLCCYQ